MTPRRPVVSHAEIAKLTTSPPPRRHAAPVWGGLLVAVGVAVAALLYTYRPAGQFFFPRCSFYSLTGLLCPGCGGLRAVHDLLHGRLMQALQENALFVLGLPLGLVWWMRQRRRGGAVLALSSGAVWAIFAVVVAFAILRNLPPFHWLAP